MEIEKTMALERKQIFFTKVFGETIIKPKHCIYVSLSTVCNFSINICQQNLSSLTLQPYNF